MVVQANIASCIRCLKYRFWAGGQACPFSILGFLPFHIPACIVPVLSWNVLSVWTRCSNQRNPRLIAPASRLEYRVASMSRHPASSTPIFAIIRRIRLISLHVGVEFVAESGWQPLKDRKVALAVIVIAEDEAALVGAACLFHRALQIAIRHA